MCCRCGREAAFQRSKQLKAKQRSNEANELSSKKIILSD
ncbi:hypothetical protein SynA1544_02030 [Synechococcus sp. A15-44]|nr:hypothetical protein SynA1544_02030 [Synechococcus sp. A15-44]